YAKDILEGSQRNFSKAQEAIAAKDEKAVLDALEMIRFSILRQKPRRKNWTQRRKRRLQDLRSKNWNRMWQRVFPGREEKNEEVIIIGDTPRICPADRRCSGG
ncbi:MAG: hypothetical protein PHN75_07995, partial [Syntrophales bacterium]|nr:hypothetical protein [Syntrophales bacterium]